MSGRLMALFVLVPLVETYLFLHIGAWMGPFPALVMIVATGFLGAWLTRSQGMSVIKRFRAALAQGRIPQQEVVEGLLVLIAGVLLLTPGFLTDAVGYLLLVPPLRRRAGNALRHYLVERFQRVTGASTSGTAQPNPSARRPSRGGPVIDAEILDK